MQYVFSEYQYIAGNIIYWLEYNLSSGTWYILRDIAYPPEYGILPDTYTALEHRISGNFLPGLVECAIENDERIRGFFHAENKETCF